MDIHRPKPFHGWREFLKEVGVISVGILIALAGEQTVEILHHARQATEAEDLVREEYAKNVTFARERLTMTPCANARLDELRAILLATDGGRPLPALDHVAGLRPPMRPFFWDQWQAAVTAGLTAHFPAARRDAYQRTYISGAMNSQEDHEQGEWATLRSLGAGSRVIDTNTRERLLQAIEGARMDARSLASDAQHLIDFTAPLDLPPPKIQVELSDPSRAPMCRPVRLSAPLPAAR